MADPRKPSSPPSSPGAAGQRPAARPGAQRPAGNRPGGGNSGSPGNAPRRPSNPAPTGKHATPALDPQQAIKRQLARRMAFAAGLIALLLGALALFDHLGTNKPPKEPAIPPAVTAPADKVADASEAPAKPEKPADNVASGKLETEPRPAPAPSDKPAEVADSKPATDSQGKPVILPPPPAPAAVPSAPTAPASPSSPTAPHAPGRTASAAPTAPVRGADAATVNKPAAPVLPRPSPGDARSEGVTRPLRHSAGGDVTAPTAPSKPSVAAPAAPSAPRVVAAEPEFTADPSVPVPRAEPGRPASIGTVPPRPVANGYVLQAGVFASHQRAEELLAKLQLNGIPATVESRVQVGPFKTREEADAVRAKLRELGISEAILVPPRAASKR